MNVYMFYFQIFDDLKAGKVLDVFDDKEVSILK